MATAGVKLHLLLLSALIASAAVVASSAPAMDGWSAAAARRLSSSSSCRGAAGGRCAEDEYDEFGLFSSASSSVRRFLATSDYISYGALQSDRVPCSVAGASYYNCKPGAEANPYTRGCSTISNCR